MNNEVYEKAGMFESAEIGLLYILTSNLIAWQEETGLTLPDFLEYMENTFPKKKKYRI